jgi:Holliday junction DNA helicase RuvA
MIAQISGKVIRQSTSSLLIDISVICYEVFVPAAIMQRIQALMHKDKPITLITYHYHNVEPSRSVPVLIGFLNEVERDFFLRFISVSGIGPRAALKALASPFSAIASAIDAGNTGFLKSLPGIGEQRAKEIIAKLQGKVGRFGLMRDEGAVAAPSEAASADIESEAIEVLVQLEYKRQEAKEMVRQALDRAPHIVNTEDLLNEVYRHKVKK